MSLKSISSDINLSDILGLTLNYLAGLSNKLSKETLLLSIISKNFLKILDSPTTVN